MPRIGEVDGLNIFIYRERGGQHSHPHFHVTGADVNASIRIDNCEVLQGSLPRNKRRAVQEYWRRHQAELRDNYNRLQNDEATYWIEG